MLGNVVSATSLAATRRAVPKPCNDHAAGGGGGNRVPRGPLCSSDSEPRRDRLEGNNNNTEGVLRDFPGRRGPLPLTLRSPRRCRCALLLAGWDVNHQIRPPIGWGAGPPRRRGRRRAQEREQKLQRRERERGRERPVRVWPPLLLHAGRTAGRLCPAGLADPVRCLARLRRASEGPTRTRTRTRTRTQPRAAAAASCQPRTSGPGRS